jgi:16S rRNA (uracil1498-N3)-methyltransferase
MLQLFYSTEINDKICVMDARESNHCIKALRYGKGDAVNVFDGTGTVYTATIADPNPHKCILNIDDAVRLPRRETFLHLAVAPTKNADRFEWLVEKAIEIGVEEITPLICEHSERRVVNLDRIEKIATAAMKQSQNLYRPTINPPVGFADFVSRAFNGVKCIAHCDEKQRRFSDVIANDANILALTGPEGDFSTTEITAATTRGFIPVTLGASRLRTETAGMVVCVLAANKITD